MGSNNDIEDEELDDDEDEDLGNDVAKKPQMTRAFKHQGCVNRVRASKLGNSVFAASWSELTKQLQAVEDDQLLKQYEEELVNAGVKPMFTFTGHQQEGFAMDWSQVAQGVLATGVARQKGNQGNSLA